MEQACSRATTELLLQHPFYGHVLCGLTRRIVTGDEVRLTVVEGRFTLLLGRAALEPLTPDQIRGVLLHELLHLLLRHPQRRGDREPSAWDIACDLVVGPLLAPGERSPNERLPHHFDLPPALPAEDYYDLLAVGGVGGVGGVSRTGPRAHIDWDGLEAGVELDLAEERFGALVQAAWARRGAPGDLPGQQLRRMLAWTGVPSVPWTAEIRRFEARARHGERKSTLHRRSRRYDTVPGLRTGDRSRIVVVLDTSGSISPDQLARFAAELRALSATGTDLHLVLCDAVVQDEMQFTGELPECLPGGGGTNLEPGLQAALARGPDGVILFTDGEIPPLRTRAPCPLLWLLTPNGRSDPGRQGVELRLPAR